MAEVLQESFEQKVTNAQADAETVRDFLNSSPDGPDKKKNAGQKSVNKIDNQTDTTKKKLPEIVSVKDEKVNENDIKLLKERIAQAKKDAAEKNNPNK
jgi:hypothetical protein